MKRHIPVWSGLAMAVVVPAWLLSTPAWAGQKGGGQSSGGQSSGSSGGSHASGGGGGGHASGGGASGGGGHASSGGGGGSARAGSDNGGARSGGGSHAGGGSGATMRGPSGSSNGSGGTAVSRGSHNGATAGTGSNTGDRAVYRGDPSVTRTPNDSVPTYSRPRNGQPSIGQAVPRNGALPPFTGGIYVPGSYFGGYYPWGFGGIGLGSFYGGYYDPFDPFDPYGYGSGYGYGYGYGSGYGYGYPQGSYSASSVDEGAIHLKVKPNDATVYVDGYYVGTVDDFDGLFQKLHLEAGSHRIEVGAPGYETLTFDVRVEPGQTTTYKGELKRIQ